MLPKISVDGTHQMNERQILKLLVLYRWLSLIPVLVAIDLRTGITIEWGAILVFACITNLTITLFSPQLNQHLINTPAILAFDVLFCGVLLIFTGGWASPYYLYAFSPLLGASFFFGLKSALTIASIMSSIYLGSGAIWGGNQLELSEVSTHFVGFFLIAGTFGYATLLLKQLQETVLSLTNAHRDLEVIHSLTLSLQSAVDVNQVQERVLSAITDDLGFPRALIGLVDPYDTVITGWLTKVREGEDPFPEYSIHTSKIPLSASAGTIPTVVLRGHPRLSVKDISTPIPELNQMLANGAYHMLPMLLRDHAVGVLIVRSVSGNNDDRIDSLRSIASQATVAIGTTMVCIDRAQRLAVQDERIRFAREIHDTVSQSLFGMSYALDACTKLLPTQPERVKNELTTITNLAEKTRRQIRQSIMDVWPSEITADAFVTDLRSHAQEFCRNQHTDFAVHINGEFENIPPRARRDLFRIAQESITNITRHAKAQQAHVCLNIGADEVVMAVRDNGCGFDVRAMINQGVMREHFGLRGIKDRVDSLSGLVEFISSPGAGASVLVTLPLNGVRSYA